MPLLSKLTGAHFAALNYDVFASNGSRTNLPLRFSRSPRGTSTRWSLFLFKVFAQSGDIALRREKTCQARYGQPSNALLKTMSLLSTS